jgi:hypothetical protein
MAQMLYSVCGFVCVCVHTLYNSQNLAAEVLPLLLQVRADAATRQHDTSAAFTLTGLCCDCH